MRPVDNTTTGGAKGHWTDVLRQREHVPLGRKSDYGIKRMLLRKQLWPRISSIPAKVAADSLFEAVLGKTHRTEF